MLALRAAALALLLLTAGCTSGEIGEFLLRAGINMGCQYQPEGCHDEDGTVVN